MSIFELALESLIDVNQELVLLFKQIDWESEFAEYYCADNGRPSVPMRKMFGALLVKIIYNLSDEGVVARWMENPYIQYLTDMNVFQKRIVVEPVVGRLKSNHRMIRNYLKGPLGYAINTLMAATAYNMRHWMNKNALSSFVSWLKTVVKGLENVIFENINEYASQNSNLTIVVRQELGRLY